MGRPVLVVSVWGDPSGWSPATYRFRGARYCSRTTLLPVVAGLSGRSLRVLLVVPDTLAATKWQGFKSWPEISSSVRELVRGYLREFSREFSEWGSVALGDLEGLVEVVVCPGVGRYPVNGGWAVFEGSLELFLLCALLNSLRRALDLAKGGGLEVYVDLSHGVNYLPSSLALASQYLRWVLELRGVEVELVALNSDPYPRVRGRGCGDVELEVHELRPPGLPKVLPQPRGEELEEALKLLLNPRTILSEGFRATYPPEPANQRLRDAVEELWYSAYYGYALLALQRGLPTLAKVAGGGSLLETYVGKLLEVLYAGLGSVPVEVEEGSYVIETSAVLNSGVAEACVRLLQVLAAVDYLAEKTSGYRNRDPAEGYTLSELEEVYRNVMSGVTYPGVEHLYGRELRELTEDVCAYTCLTGRQEFDWTLWSELKRRIREALGEPPKEGREEPENCVRRCSENEEIDRGRIRVRYSEKFKPSLEDRNFIAHLGLLYNGVEASLRAQSPSRQHQQ